MYTDRDFAANKYSLITDWNLEHEEVNEAKGSDWESIVWVRAPDIDDFKDTQEEGELALFQKGIESNDI